MLRASVEARSGVLTALTGVLAPILGGLVFERSEQLCLLLAALLAALQLPVLAWSEETLPMERRQPFAWRKAEPIGNLLILFQGGCVRPWLCHSDSQ